MVLVQCPSEFHNPFEASVFKEVSSRLEGLDCDGFALNNILLPIGRHSRQDPDEHDILLLLPWAAYTIDAKAWEPGDYQVPGNGTVKWRPVQFKAAGDEGWRQASGLVNPFRIANQKAAVLRSVLKRASEKFGKYRVDSLIVFPRGVRMRRTRHVEPSRMEEAVAFNLRVTTKDQLVDLLLKDRADYQAQVEARAPGRTYSPPMDELREAFEAMGGVEGDGDPAVGITVGGVELIARLPDTEQVDDGDQIYQSPESGGVVPISSFKGRLGISRDPLHVAIYRKWPWMPQTERFQRVARRRLRALTRADLANVIRVRHEADLPGFLVIGFKPVEGRTMEQWARSHGPMQSEHALTLLSAVAEKVAEIHELGIRHVGVSSKGVVLANSFPHGAPHNFTLTGPAIANPLLLDEESRVTTVRGGDFTAPELTASGGIRGSVRSDVFSLGRLLAYSLVGDDGWGASIAKEFPTLRPDVREIVLRATSPLLEARYASPREFAAALPSTGREACG